MATQTERQKSVVISVLFVLNKMVGLNRMFYAFSCMESSSLLCKVRCGGVLSVVKSVAGGKKTEIIM